MARKPRVFAPGALYHVIVRGNQRRRTFLSSVDYDAYRERLDRYRSRYGTVLYAYCLMPNHVHLLVEMGELPLSAFMQGLQQSYTQYFNRTHRKVGHAFQGRYKAILCDKDTYLLALVRYIHLNPVRAGLVKEPGAYPYSGHGAYVRSRPDGIVDPRLVLGMLGGAGAYGRFLGETSKAEHDNSFYEVEDQRFLGPEGFGESLRKEAGEKVPRTPRRPLGEAAKRLAGQLGVSVILLRGPDRGWKISSVRRLAAYVLTRRAGYPMKEVAEWLGRDPTTMSHLVHRLSGKIESDPAEDSRIRSLIESTDIHV